MVILFSVSNFHLLEGRLTREMGSSFVGLGQRAKLVNLSATISQRLFLQFKQSLPGDPYDTTVSKRHIAP